MRALFSFITVLLTLAFFVTGVVYLIARTFGSIAWNPESKMFRRMLENLRARLKAVSTELVSWDAEMVGLLSLNRVNEKKRGWFSPISSGQFTTIYQEPVVAYVTQEMGKMSVTLVRTSDREFIFRRKEKETEIWLNNQPFGVFTGGALLAPGKNPRLLARLEQKTGEAQFPLLIGNAAALTLNNPERAVSPNPRALSLLRALSPEEESAALAVVLEQLTR